jgi:hypothetical protein
VDELEGEGGRGFAGTKTTDQALDGDAEVALHPYVGGLAWEGGKEGGGEEGREGGGTRRLRKKRMGSPPGLPVPRLSSLSPSRPPSLPSLTLSMINKSWPQYKTCTGPASSSVLGSLRPLPPPLPPPPSSTVPEASRSACPRVGMMTRARSMLCVHLHVVEHGSHAAIIVGEVISR